MRFTIILTVLTVAALSTNSSKLPAPLVVQFPNEVASYAPVYDSLPDYLTINAGNVDQEDEAVVLAALAWHEARTLSQQERHLIMEATWNRVTMNYGGWGNTLAAQLKAPGQYPNLFTDLYFDGKNVEMVANYYMAKEVVTGKRIQTGDRPPIKFWAGPSCSISWQKVVDKNAITTTFKTVHKFS